MTFERRNEIFSKEALSITDVAELLGISYASAQQLIQTIRRHNDRLNIQGKVHIQDYIDYFHLPPERYYAPLHPPILPGAEQSGTKGNGNIEKQQ